MMPGARVFPLSGCALLLGAIQLGLVGCSCEAAWPSRAAGATKAGHQARPIRAVWVARFHYHSPGDIREIIRNCAELGLNTVLWQVRGEATVAYPSRLEPWLGQYGYADPGFDPLKIAVEEAHRHGLRIEAWCNVMPGWKGPDPPPLAAQLYNARPDWFLYDANGQRQPLRTRDARGREEGFYVILNPCLPAVRAHIVAVFEEIVTGYAVDGLHLDYVRYAWDTTPDAARRFPRDPQTVELFRRQTGRTPESDPAAWSRWRAAQLTRLVQEIRAMLDRRRPGATLTAAVWGDPRDGLEGYFQNATAWLACGLLDAAYPMIYRRDLASFERDLGAYRRAVPHGRIVPGLGIYLHEQAELMRAQLAACRAMAGGDFALFSYESLLPIFRERARPDRVADAGRADVTGDDVRAARRAVLRKFLATP